MDHALTLTRTSRLVLDVQQLSVQHHFPIRSHRFHFTTRLVAAAGDRVSSFRFVLANQPPSRSSQPKTNGWDVIRFQPGGADHHPSHFNQGPTGGHDLFSTNSVIPDLTGVGKPTPSIAIGTVE